MTRTFRYSQLDTADVAWKANPVRREAEPGQAGNKGPLIDYRNCGHHQAAPYPVPNTYRFISLLCLIGNRTITPCMAGVVWDSVITAPSASHPQGGESTLHCKHGRTNQQHFQVTMLA